MPVKETSKSSAIERVGYNPQTRCLSIWFRKSRKYVFSDVPAEIYEELCNATSAGQFVCQRIVGKFDRIFPKLRGF